MTNSLHFSEWRNCIRAQRKVNLCAPGTPKGPKVGMFVRQYEIVCANDAGRAPRKYPGTVRKVSFAYRKVGIITLQELSRNSCYNGRGIWHSKNSCQCHKSSHSKKISCQSLFSLHDIKDIMYY